MGGGTRGGGQSGAAISARWGLRCWLDQHPSRPGRTSVACCSGADPCTPLAAPLYADLHALPPLLIHVGTAETLLDDATRLAERAKAAGVNVTLEAWEDMIHVWHLFAPLLPEGQQAVERVGEYV